MNGTQKNSTFQRKERGMHAGKTPVEKERADAVVMEESAIGQGTQVVSRDTSLCPLNSIEPMGHLSNRGTPLGPNAI